MSHNRKLSPCGIHSVLYTFFFLVLHTTAVPHHNYHNNYHMPEQTTMGTWYSSTIFSTHMYRGRRVDLQLYPALYL